jgi:hypothetical protein
MGSLPAMMATSHTKHDHTSAEFALLKVRISYNHNTFDRYKMEKQLKRNGNEWFNWEKIGNYLSKGYWKIVPHIFEGDKESFFASIFSKGIYLYEEDPHEYFTNKLTGGKYTSNLLVGGNSQIESIFQKDLEETGGHDNVSQARGGLWVYKTSYIKRQDGTSDNIFVKLMNKANSYRNHSFENSDRWVFKHPQTWSTEINMDEYATYVYDLKFFSSDHKNTHGVKGATKIVAEQIAEGNRSAIKVRFIGNLEIKKGQDDPNEIGSSLPMSGGTEQMPVIPAEKNDEFIDTLEKINQPEAEKQQEDEIQDELQPEPEQQKENENQNELENEEELTITNEGLTGTMIFDGFTKLRKINVGNNSLSYLVIKNCPQLHTLRYAHNALRHDAWYEENNPNLTTIDKNNHDGGIIWDQASHDQFEQGELKPKITFDKKEESESTESEQHLTQITQLIQQIEAALTDNNLTEASELLTELKELAKQPNSLIQADQLNATIAGLASRLAELTSQTTQSQSIPTKLIVGSLTVGLVIIGVMFWMINKWVRKQITKNY